MSDVSSNASEVAARLRAFNITATIVDWIDRAASPTLITALKAEAPYGDRSNATGARATGPHLRDRIWSERHSGVGHVETVFQTDRSPVAAFVLGGTKPHDIRPRGDWPLTFYWDKAGGVVQSWGWHGEKYGMVKHPGTKANPFNVRAWMGVEMPLAEMLVDRLAETLR